MDHSEIEAVLDRFHASAAAADEDGYFATLAEGAVFLGTAPGERWAGADFREFVHTYFSQGKGWAYKPSARSIDVARDGQTAWFDETVENEFYGECRGSGVLQQNDNGWRIEQYNLTIPVPDDLATDLVTRIREIG